MVLRSAGDGGSRREGTASRSVAIRCDPSRCARSARIGATPKAGSSAPRAGCGRLPGRAITSSPLRSVASFDPGRPGRTGITPRTPNQLSLLHAALVHHVELRRAGARRAEEDVAAVGRPRRVDVVAAARGELLRLPARGAHHHDLEAPADAPG